MLIGNSSKKPNLETIRRIKQALRNALNLEPDAMVTVTQLACLEEDCAPLETVIGLLQPNQPQLQHKIHKSTESIVVEDLIAVCTAWGQTVEKSAVEQLFKEH